MKQIILASTSPRRRELMGLLGIPFQTVAANFGEDMTLPLPAQTMVKQFAVGKAKSVQTKFPNALIVSADTIVAYKNKKMGKPHSPDHAKEMLTILSGKWHEVYTGVAILNTESKKIFSKVVKTKIKLRKISTAEIDAYVRSGEPLDRAGAYAIQGTAAVFVEKVDGDFLSVIGLPVAAVADGLKKFGVDVLIGGTK